MKSIIEFIFNKSQTEKIYKGDIVSFQVRNNDNTALHKGKVRTFLNDYGKSYAWVDDIEPKLTGRWVLSDRIEGKVKNG
jgi:translation elongation factor EF-1alpha